MPRKAPDLVRPRGRPRKGEIVTLVPSQRKAARNVSMDADLADEINLVADSLSEELGFRPTISQTLRHLIRKART